MKIILLPQARLDLREAVRFYDQESRDLTERFFTEFERTIERIKHFPNARPKASRTTRRGKFRKFPYSIVYRIQKDTVVIFAVEHGSRRPGYWRGGSS